MEQNTDITYQTIPKGRGFLYAHANQLCRQVKKHGSTRYLKCYYDFCDGSAKLESGDFFDLILSTESVRLISVCISFSLGLPAGLRVAQPCRYCFTQWSENGFFRPAGATPCPDKRESWHGGADHAQVSSPAPTFTFIGTKMWEYSPQNCLNFKFWPQLCSSGATRLQYFFSKFSAFVRVYR